MADMECQIISVSFDLFFNHNLLKTDNEHFSWNLKCTEVYFHQPFSLDFFYSSSKPVSQEVI